MARIQLGELSAARQALEGAEVAPGTLATLAEFTNPERRPQVPRQPINEDVMRMVPGEQFQLDPDEFLIGLRKARRGVAAGPSGMTSDHLYPILESEADSDLLVQVGALLSVGNVPESILNAIRLGRITALCKPDGGVRGIVVGDILRRLVENRGQAGIKGGGNSHRSLPVRPVHQGRLRVRRSYVAVDHGFGPRSHRHFDRRDWGVRSDLEERDARGTPPDGERRSDPPLREMFLWDSINIFVGRRDGSHPTHPPRGGEGRKATPSCRCCSH